jgi:hypothetical protein
LCIRGRENAITNSEGWERIQNWIIRVFNDPLAQILLKNSYLTRPQLETLLIDTLADQMIDGKIGGEDRPKMRLREGGVSRGAFNRTLRQSKRNVERSIYTVLLLGYIGMLDTPSLGPFIEASNKLESYMVAYRKAWKDLNSRDFKEDKVNNILFLQNQLQETLNGLLSSKNSTV